MNVDATITNLPASGPATTATLPKSDGSEFRSQFDQAMQKGATVGQEDKKLKKVCQDMESVFINMMLSTMRSTVPKDSLLGDSNEDDILKSMLDSEMAKNLSQAGGIGLSDVIYKQLAPLNAKAAYKAKE
ncbi:MAG: rod-binding protein [Sporomusaceae bacterium]|nr:rod-binding protein [Sporomusaceae bacterium]